MTLDDVAAVEPREAIEARAAGEAPEAREAPESREAREARLREALARERTRHPSRIRSALHGYGYPALTIAVILVAWQVATMVLDIPPFLLPGPAEIALEMVDAWDALLRHGLITLVEILLGYALAVLVGIPLAVAISYSRTFERTVYPLLVSSQVIPKVAIAPLFLVWFGFGTTPKVVITFLICFFPIVIDTTVGLRSTPREMVWLTRSMGASAWQAFWKVRLPHALPSIFGGLKVAITLAVVGAIVGEFVGADSGLGYLIRIANGQLDTRLTMAAIAMLSIMGVLLFLAVGAAERLLVRGPAATRGRAGGFRESA